MPDDSDGRRLTRQGQERKQQLLDHATQLFAERGYAETRVVDIVRAAGVAKGLFYWYFDNKEAVFRELVESARLQMRRFQATAIDPDADPLVRIRQGAEASILFMREHRRLYSMFDLEPVDQKLTELLRRGGDIHVRDTARHVADGIAQGLVREDDPVLLAWGVVGTVTSYSHLYRTGRLGDVSVLDVMRLTGRFVVRALAASDEIARAAESDSSEPSDPSGSSDSGRDLRTNPAHITPEAATAALAR